MPERSRFAPRLPTCCMAECEDTNVVQGPFQFRIWFCTTHLPLVVPRSMIPKRAPEVERKTRAAKAPGFGGRKKA